MNILKQISIQRILLLLVLILLMSNYTRGKNHSTSKYIARQSDSLELVKFYEVANGKNWVMPWKLTDEISDWYGVKLDKYGRNVIAIDLDGLPDHTAKNKNGNGLKGQLPDLNLPKLTTLFLGGNDLKGTIPNFKYLNNIKVICLSSNNLHGQIPDFDKLPNLERFELDYNETEGVIPGFAKCPKLRFLYLPNNKLQGEIPNFDLPKLEVLLLGNNQLSGQMPTLEACKKLKLLRLNGNHLSGIVPPLQHLRKVQFIDLANNEFSALPQLGSMPQLDQLKVAGNQLDFDDLVPNSRFFMSPNDYLNQQIEVADAVIEKYQGEAYRLEMPSKHSALSTFQWYKNDEPYGEASYDNFQVFEALTTEDAGFYQCKITHELLPELAFETGIVTLQVVPNFDKNTNAEAANIALSFSGILTPNGDGKQDVFKVFSADEQIDLSNSTLEIYTANAQLVYRAAPYRNNWQGTKMTTNEALASGYYFYKFTLDSNTKTPFTGTIIITK